jgi:hypothetical protein
MKIHRLLKAVLVLGALPVAVTFAHAEPTVEGPQARAVQKLKDADADGDGLLSKAEAEKLPRLARHFERIDGNGDGKLSRQELRTAREKAQQFREENFSKLRDLESESHQCRIQILQQAEACIKAATTAQAYRQCEEQEQAARQALRENIRSGREDLVAQARK